MSTLFLLGLILVNGLFAMTEIAVVSARRTRLQARADRGHPAAAAALKLAESPSRFLSTVQIGVTLVGVCAGAFGEARLSGGLEERIAAVEPLAPYARSLALASVVIVITFLSILFGELIPKRIALAHAERVAEAAAVPMRWIAYAASPVVWVLSSLTDLLTRPFLSRQAGHRVTQEDIKGLVEVAAESGAVFRAEQHMVEGVFRLGDRRVKAIMVPRTEIEWLDAADPPDRVRAVISASYHSHYPLCRGGLDEIVGIVHVKDLSLHDPAAPLDLAALARPVLFVPEGTAALKLLDTFKVRGTHVALVVDEYGSVEGLITFNDIVESVIGEVTRPGRPEEPLITLRDDGSWLLDGGLPLDQLRDLMQSDTLPTDEMVGETDVHTLSGLVMTYLGHIPRAGEAFQWGTFRFEVLDMDGQHVDKVLLARAAPPAD